MKSENGFRQIITQGTLQDDNYSNLFQRKAPAITNVAIGTTADEQRMGQAIPRALINNRKADHGIATFRYFSPIKNQTSEKRSGVSLG